MNKPSESISHTTGKTDGIDPKTGDNEPSRVRHEPGSESGPTRPQREPTSTPPDQGPAKEVTVTAATKQEVARSTRAIKQEAQQFLGYSEAISMAATDVMQRYFSTIERSTQRYCHAVNAYLDAFREEGISAGSEHEDNDSPARQASALSHPQRSRTDSLRSGTRV